MYKTTIAAVLVIGVVLTYYNRKSMRVLYSVIISKLSPIDADYIRKREWINEKGKIISFDNLCAKLHGNVIIIDNEPKYRILNLNKYLNEFTSKSFDNGIEKFTSTEELVK